MVSKLCFKIILKNHDDDGTKTKCGLVCQTLFTFRQRDGAMKCCPLTPQKASGVRGRPVLANCRNQDGSHSRPARASARPRRARLSRRLPALPRDVARAALVSESGLGEKNSTSLTPTYFGFSPKLGSCFDSLRGFPTLTQKALLSVCM